MSVHYHVFVNNKYKTTTSNENKALKIVNDLNLKGLKAKVKKEVIEEYVTIKIF